MGGADTRTGSGSTGYFALEPALEDDAGESAAVVNADAVTFLVLELRERTVRVCGCGCAGGRCALALALVCGRVGNAPTARRASSSARKRCCVSWALSASIWVPSWVISGVRAGEARRGEPQMGEGQAYCGRLSAQRTSPQVKHRGVYDESVCARATISCSLRDERK